MSKKLKGLLLALVLCLQVVVPVTKADAATVIYNNKTGYEVAWEYAKEVIELVEGDIDEPEVPELDNEIAIDVSELYK